MATSVRDLAYQLQVEAALLPGHPRTSTAVRPALNHLGRALHRLSWDGLDHADRRGRSAATDELTEACLRLAPSADLGVETVEETRPTRLAAALSDALSIRSERLGYEQRWAAAATLAHTARTLTNYSQHDLLPSDLDWVRRAARAVCAHALTDPPIAQATPALDAPIPSRTPTGDPTPLALSVEAAALLFERVSRSANRPPSLVEIFAMTRAGESAVRYATGVAAVLADQPVPSVHQAPAAWLAVRGELQPFTASAAFSAREGDVTLWSRIVHVGLRDAFGPVGQISRSASLDPASLRHLEHIVSLVPELAEGLARATVQLADLGDLHAVAHRLPHREDRTVEFVAHRPVVADRWDLEPAQQALLVAAGHSAETAVELHYSAGGGDQPGLIEAHVARARTGPHRAEPPERRWRPLADAVDPRVAADPHWPALAAHLQRTHTTGGNVALLLSQALDDGPLPQRDPARALDYRLSNGEPRRRSTIRPTPDEPARAPRAQERRPAAAPHPAPRR